MDPNIPDEDALLAHPMHGKVPDEILLASIAFGRTVDLSKDDSGYVDEGSLDPDDEA